MKEENNSKSYLICKHAFFSTRYCDNAAAQESAIQETKKNNSHFFPLLTADSHTAKLFCLPEKEYWTAGKLVFAKDLEHEQENFKITKIINLLQVYLNMGIHKY